MEGVEVGHTARQFYHLATWWVALGKGLKKEGGGRDLCLVVENLIIIGGTRGSFFIFLLNLTAFQFVPHRVGRSTRAKVDHQFNNYLNRSFA
ncbi:hypothetical protein pipiens_005918 [Culex pipiens pipiens]|uniref:Uncharacterized protein n=1 Tax=Culex pipiens pipiens TaxID=38569 RepID=A0ABD1DT43_CULPP